MSDRHIAAELLESYVIGALDDADVARVEAHVFSCRVCEAKLQREAELDLAFTQVATRVIENKPKRITRLVVPAFGAGAALAMAAAVLLWVLPRGESDAHAASSPVDDGVPVVTETNADASTVTASLDLQVDGSRLGVRD